MPAFDCFVKTQLFPASMDDHSDYDTDSSDCSRDMSLAPFSAHGTGSSRTSHDVSMRSASPAQSVWSLTPSMREQAFKQEYGRGLNNYSEVYRLPADDEELERLEMQNQMLIDITGRYAPPFQDIMRDDTPGEPKQCLDIGCGAGAWILQVAREYPNCNAVAVDLIPMQSLDMPANCRSEIDDVNLGLEHFYGDFNVVHAHLICAGIQDFSNLIDQIGHVLRPRGLIDLLEYEYHIYDPDHKRIVVDTTKLDEPWWPRWLAHAHRAITGAGGDVEAGMQFHNMINSTGLFDPAVVEDHWVPAGPHKLFSQSQEISRSSFTMRSDITQFIKAGRPLLLKSGVAENVVDILQNNAIRELMEERYPYLIHIRKVWATKKH